MDNMEKPKYDAPVSELIPYLEGLGFKTSKMDPKFYYNRAIAWMKMASKAFKEGETWNAEFYIQLASEDWVLHRVAKSIQEMIENLPEYQI